MPKDSYYFKHDAHARHDPKIRSLIKKYGLEGYGRFWIIIEMLRESSKYKIEDAPWMWDAIAEQMHCEEEAARKFIKDCIEKFQLFEQENGFFYSPSLLERMVKLDEIRLKRIRAAKDRWNE